jgi:hypothetical protein
MTKKELRCEECNSIVGEVQNGALVIRARHHGEQHVTTWSIATLLALAHCDGPGKVTIAAEPVSSNHKGELLR